MLSDKYNLIVISVTVKGLNSYQKKQTFHVRLETLSYRWVNIYVAGIDWFYFLLLSKLSSIKYINFKIKFKFKKYIISKKKCSEQFYVILNISTKVQIGGRISGIRDWKGTGEGPA